MAIAYAQTISGDVKTVVGKFTANILDPLVTFLFVVAVVYFLVGVLKFVYNSGDETGREEGKQHILWGIIGLVIMITVFGIMHFIENSLPR